MKHKDDISLVPKNKQNRSPQITPVIPATVSHPHIPTTQPSPHPPLPSDTPKIKLINPHQNTPSHQPKPTTQITHPTASPSKDISSSQITPYPYLPKHRTNINNFTIPQIVVPQTYSQNQEAGGRGPGGHMRVSDVSVERQGDPPAPVT